jgi:hypothetical protein
MYEISPLRSLLRTSSSPFTGPTVGPRRSAPRSSGSISRKIPKCACSAVCTSRAAADRAVLRVASPGSIPALRKKALSCEPPVSALRTSASVASMRSTERSST